MVSFDITEETVLEIYKDKVRVNYDKYHFIPNPDIWRKVEINNVLFIQNIGDMNIYINEEQTSYENYGVLIKPGDGFIFSENRSVYLTGPRNSNYKIIVNSKGY